MPGTDNRMYIQAYSKNDYSPASAIGEKFVVQVNPESYKISYKIKLDKTQSAGCSAGNPKYNKTPPPDLSVDILFDGTGVLNDASLVSVAVANPLDAGLSNGDITQRLETFKNRVLNYNGQIHQPNYLKLHWGTLTFKGRISTMDIEFKLFSPQGAPIRAVAKLGLTGSIADDLRKALEDSQSPDITHRRVFSAFDRLPLMTQRIYGDGRYYLEVSRFNGLNSFRKIAEGTFLNFPPLQS